MQLDANQESLAQADRLARRVYEGSSGMSLSVLSHLQDLARGQMGHGCVMQSLLWERDQQAAQIKSLEQRIEALEKAQHAGAGK